MPIEEQVALDCPYCHTELYQPLRWFKQSYFTCPACEGGLSDQQFAPTVEALELAFDESIAEMLRGPSGCNCGCKKATD